MTAASTVTATQQPRQPPRHGRKRLKTIVLLAVIYFLYNVFIGGSKNKILLESVLSGGTATNHDSHSERLGNDSNRKSPIRSTETQSEAIQIEQVTTTAPPTTTAPKTAAPTTNNENGETPEIIHVIQSR